jgi:hypothetical protein
MTRGASHSGGRRSKSGTKSREVGRRQSSEQTVPNGEPDTEASVRVSARPSSPHHYGSVTAIEPKVGAADVVRA